MPANFLTPEDQFSFGSFGFGAQSQPAFKCVHQAFKYQAKSHPSNIAVDDITQIISYGDLDRKSDCIASHLRTLGIKPGARVCILADRSILLIVAILATIKTGAAYVPLDGSIVSTGTLDHVMEDSKSAVILSTRKFSDRVCGKSPATIILDDFQCQCESKYCHKLPDFSTSGDSVYIVYTSGTTGTPKGVEVTHGNVTNLLCMAPGSLGMGPGMKVSQLMNISFDMAAWEILGSLCNGATLCLRGKSSAEWRAVMKKVDIVIATPSILLKHNPSDYPNIKTVAVAGEPCPQGTADIWGKSAKFYNCCGPTEITIVNTMHLHAVGQPLSIGKPTPNNNVYILDENMQPVPIGKPGIMWAGGSGITKGYLNLPDKTSERYKLDPFTDNRSIMFNTGDLGCWRADGTLEHLGRIDDQVKIKGFRVELDGVAAALETHPDVEVAIALVINSQLWGFVTPEIPDVNAVKEYAAHVQPYYAVPERIISLADFPKTPNGKTDKRALRQLVQDGIDVLSESKNKQGLRAESAIKVKIDLPVFPLPVYGVSASPISNSSSSSDTSSSEVSSNISITHSETIEKLEHPWDGYEDDDIPSKTQGKRTRNLRHIVFTLYRRLFTTVFLANAGIFIWMLSRQSVNAKGIGEIVIINIFCCILMRQEYVINFLFTVLCAVPTSWPLSIRRVCARVYHIPGGVHSGCGVSGAIWLVFFTGKATQELVDHGPVSIPTVVVSYCILLLLVAIIMLAYPTFRTKKHDFYERSHRFLGWTATALVWTQVIFLTNDYREINQSLGSALVHSAPFWLTCVLTVSIILPWIRLRKVPVRSVVLSPHAVRLYFDYVTPIPGTFTRISTSPLTEWHGFATVPAPSMKGYSLVVSRAGDWTAQQISDPPKSLWVRGIPTCGVLRIVPLFRRVVFVATGSGIGPCAPCILAKTVPIRLLWTAPNVRETFGNELVDSVLDAEPGAVIYDTRRYSKPNMVKLTLRLVREFDAEAVCVISNTRLTRKVVYGMMSRGIPAFGAIWDS